MELCSTSDKHCCLEKQLGISGFETVNLSTGGMSTYSTMNSKPMHRPTGSGREAEGKMMSYSHPMEKEKPC